MQPVVSDVDQLSSFPFISSTVLDDLKTELPAYIAKADSVDSKYCSVFYDAGKVTQLIYLTGQLTLAHKVLLVQPSSAVAERVFSLLSNSFCDHQFNAS